ncbi:MAG: GntR family transcriptional regulator [Synoicihabitans sp.]
MNQISSDELGAKAYQRVRSMILSGRLPAGKKIVQDRLAEKLGISRTPLRSALQRLEGESLVQSIPRRGMIVREFSQEQVIDFYDCRIALESMAVRLFTSRVSVAELKVLAELFVPFQTGDIDENAYRRADSKFHDFIAQNCGNDMLRRLFVSGHLLVCIDLIGLVRPPAETLPEHLAIIEAITQGDADQAESLIRSHLLISQNLVRQRLHEPRP